MKFFLTFLFFPFTSFAQPDPNALTGLWKGYVSTSEKELPYELVLTVKDGKLMGYSHTTFTVAGKDIVSVKQVSVRIQNQSLIVEDEDLLYDNFDAEAPRKIKQTNTLFFKEEGKTLELTGTFESKATRTMRPAHGSVVLQKKYTADDTKLIAKLDDLNISKDISINLIPPTDLAVATPAPQLLPKAAVITEDKKATPKEDPFITAEVKKSARDIAIASVSKSLPEPIAIPDPEPEQIMLAKQMFNRQSILAGRPATRPLAVLRRQSNRDDKVVAFLRYRVTQPVVMPATSAPIIAAAKPVKPVTQSEVTKNTPPVTKTQTNTISPVRTAQPVRTNIAVAPVLSLANRKIETIDQLTIVSDSLVLSLYDNGVVDGDSVSIILNGKTIVSKQMLSTVAFTKTIYLTQDMGDSVQLVMYAENLGSIAPNTGLLVLVYDNQRREIRFSGDLNKNAAITLRRRPRG